MKKIFKMLSVFTLSIMMFTNYVYAYGYDLSVTSNSVTVGNSITLNIKVTDAAGKFTVSSSNSQVLSVSQSTLWIDNQTASVTLKANKEGTATINVAAGDVTSYSGNNITGSKSVTITVKAKQVVNNNGNHSGSGNTYVAPKPKSSNNFLTSLTIDGLKLTETFDKEKLEYSVIVPAETEKIKINAQVNDESARVTGTGEVKVTPGLNTFEIVVTAANGSKRTYKLNATVEELKPIKVNIDGKDYTVVRKIKELPKISEYYEEKDITIDNEKVEAYYNEKLDYTLVGLKDSKGNIEFYIYNKNKYTLYKEYTFNGTTLQILDTELPKGYKKTNFIYDDDAIASYQEVKLDIIKNTYALDNNDIVGNQFYLFYATNVETGKTNLYQYDALEKTVQRYNIDLLEMYKEHSNRYYMYLLLSILIIAILTVAIITKSILNSKKKKIKEVKKPTRRKKKIEEGDE